MTSSPANKARLLSSSAAHASSWLSVVPSVGLALQLDSSEFHTAVKWWLGMNSTARSSDWGREAQCVLSRLATLLALRPG